MCYQKKCRESIPLRTTSRFFSLTILFFQIIRFSVTVTQSTKLGIDVNRHKEIIIKAVSAILLLYLKHFKINHVYQFEFMSQHLVFANCIPLVLKFFNQNLLAYVGSKNVSVLRCNLFFYFFHSESRTHLLIILPFLFHIPQYSNN